MLLPCVYRCFFFYSNFPLLTSIPYCGRVISLCRLFLISFLCIDMLENNQSRCNHSEFSHHLTTFQSALEVEFSIYTLQSLWKIIFP